MDRIKHIMSDHLLIPLKMVIITLLLWFIYASFLHIEIDLAFSILLSVGGLIGYNVISALAQLISFNGKRINDTVVYFIYGTINKKISKIIAQHYIFDDKPGVFINTGVKIEEGTYELVYDPISNPIEFYYTIRSYISILSTIDTYSSNYLIEKLDLYLIKSKEMISTEELSRERMYANL